MTKKVAISIKKFNFQFLAKQYLWIKLGVLSALFLLMAGCFRSTNLVQEHSFSNLVLDGDTLWFGAGYKLYRADLTQKIATIVYDTGDVPIFFVQIDKGRLFFGGGRLHNFRKKVLWALDLDKEKLLWSHKFNDDFPFSSAHLSPPIIYKEVLMISTLEDFYALDKASGDFMWRIQSNWFYDFTPIIANEQLIYGVDKLGEGTQPSHTIAFADPYSGKTMRTISLLGQIGGTPAVHGDCFFVKDDVNPDPTGLGGHYGLRLNCIDLNSGEIIWFVEGSGFAEESQIGFYNGKVFDVFSDQLFAIDEQSGELLWQSPSLDHERIINPQVIEDLEWIALETLETKKIFFLDLVTGKQRNEMLLDVLSPPVFIGHEAIYGTTNAIIRVDIVTGETIWSIPVDSHYLTEHIKND